MVCLKIALAQDCKRLFRISRYPLCVKIQHVSSMLAMEIMYRAPHPRKCRILGLNILQSLEFYFLYICITKMIWSEGLPSFLTKETFHWRLNSCQWSNLLILLFLSFLFPEILHDYHSIHFRLSPAVLIPSMMTSKIFYTVFFYLLPIFTQWPKNSMVKLLTSI